MSDVHRGQVVADAAQVYDELFVPALFGQWGPRVVHAAGVAAGDRVLDVGCGTGVAARAAATATGARGHVVGLDVNEGMLAVARRHTRGSVTWRDGAAEALPFDDASFERVLCQFALMFFDDRHAALAEMARVLVPGGRVAVATWAAADESPGYAAMIEVLDELFGPAVADALRAPFVLGDAATLCEVIVPVFPDVRVGRHDGVARFPSLRVWIDTDIRGWTLADALDEDAQSRLHAAAGDALGRFVQRDGTVAFPAPALIAVASRSPG